jgi:alpha-tubulin suppressor-like RCC1 family protein
MLPFARMVKYGNKVAPPSGVLKIATSFAHMAMLFDTNNLYLRGLGSQYRLGNDSQDVVQNGWVQCPYKVSNVWCLFAATIILTTDGEFYLAGQMGYLGVSANPVPGWTNITSRLSTIPGITTVQDIASSETAASNGSILILLSNGDVYGLGRNTGGELGVTGAQSTPIKIDSGVTMIAGTQSGGALHYVKNTQYYRCGSNANYNLGTTASKLSTFTVSPDISGSVIGISCSTYTTSVLTSNRNNITVYSAGINTEYCLGIGYGDTKIIMSPFSATPAISGMVPDAGSMNNHSINYSVMAMTQNGKLYTCGSGVPLGWPVNTATDRSFFHQVQYEGMDTPPDVNAFSVQGGSGLLYALVGTNEVYWCGSGTFMAEQSPPVQQITMKKMILPE